MQIQIPRDLGMHGERLDRRTWKRSKNIVAIALSSLYSSPSTPCTQGVRPSAALTAKAIVIVDRKLKCAGLTS